MFSFSVFNYFTIHMIDVLKKFYADNADAFLEAPLQIAGEQNLEYYAIFQRYLRLFEQSLQEYIDNAGVGTTEFYRALQTIQGNPEIKDKKLLYFVDYLVASADYEAFYKMMVRAAKKVRRAEEKTSDTFSESKSDVKESPSRDAKGHK
ncbi:hypothetical protein EON65_01730 [archaeon]|nr:MAG: hypothetical protein EON65_01730 [archaeon]